ncbi:MAG: phosphoglucosamine mutase [Alphaproteobacteria bacterium]|nr:phosphoglucosamine mutase [Alphaproteobacteria bacterium]
MKQYPEHLFGTDGIRGTANDPTISPEVMIRVARLAGHLAGQRATKGKRQDELHRVVIGKDTRLSGYMLEPALTAGFVSVGMDVLLVGPIPTPGLAMLTQSMRAELGVMISASHNLYRDNGIKLFGSDGYKIPEAMEKEIEKLMNADLNPKAEAEQLGRAKRIDDAMGRYIEFVKNSFPKNYSLEGLKIVVDCAHGAAYKIAPTVLSELGADVIAIGVAPNGLNINLNSGSLHPAAIIDVVRKEKADVGIALDGDADRLLLVDEQGEQLNGDKILAIIAHHWRQQGRLQGGVVGTVMSNLGLERFIQTLGVAFARVPVGDKNIIQKIRPAINGQANNSQSEHYIIGAEPSGHVVMKNYGTTGDGLMAALQVLLAMRVGNQPLSHLRQLYQETPEKTVNLKLKLGVDVNSLLTDHAVVPVLQQMKQKVKNDGGLFLLRPSGTEKSILRLTVQMQGASGIDGVIGAMTDSLKKFLL